MKAKVVVLLLASACLYMTVAATQLTQSALFLRTTIEEYPEAERRPILNYLDAARGVADKVAENFAATDDDAILAVIGRTASATNQQVDVKAALAQMHEELGTVTAFEYRAQAIEEQGPKPDVHDLARASSVTYYALRATKQPEVERYLLIRTAHNGLGHLVFDIQILDYAAAVPPFLKAK